MNFIPREPSLKMNPKKFVFNAPCMRLLPDTDYVQFFHNFKEGVLFAKGCRYDEYDSTPWRRNCSSQEVCAKNVKWSKFYKEICTKMNWPQGNSYKIPAKLSTYQRVPVIFFNLNRAKSMEDAWLEKELFSISKQELISEVQT